MDQFAMWLGYAVMVLSGVVATLAGIAWGIDYGLRQLGFAKDVLEWYGDKLRKRRTASPAT